MSAEENSTADVADALVASLGFEPTEGKKLGRKAGSSSSNTDELSEGDSATVEDANDTPSIDDGFSVVPMDADSGTPRNKATNGRGSSATKTGSGSAGKGAKAGGSNRQNRGNRRPRNQGQKQGQGSSTKTAKDPKAALADIKSAAKPTVSEQTEESAAKAETEAVREHLNDAKREAGFSTDPKEADGSDSKVAENAATTRDLDKATLDEAVAAVGAASPPPPPSASDAIKIDDAKIDDAKNLGLSADTIAAVIPTDTDSDAAGGPLAGAKAKAKAKVADVAAKAKVAESGAKAKLESKTGSEHKTESGASAKTAATKVEAKADSKIETKADSKIDLRPDAKVAEKLELAPLQDSPVPTEVPTAPPLAQPAEIRRPAARVLTPGTQPSFPNPFKRKRRVQARKVRRVVRHIDPWSVLTFSVLFHLCVFAALLLASVLVWNAAEAAGTIENLETFITELGDYDAFTIEGDTVFRAAVAIAGILTLASSVMLVLLTVVFNLISDLVGGIRLTVIEEETVRVRRRKTTG